MVGMNLVADLMAVEERIAETRARIRQQEAILHRLGQLNARPFTMLVAEQLYHALADDMLAELAHRDGLAAALEKHASHGILAAMQAGLDEQHWEIDDLPFLAH